MVIGNYLLHIYAATSYWIGIDVSGYSGIVDIIVGYGTEDGGLGMALKNVGTWTGDGVSGTMFYQVLGTATTRFSSS